MITHRIQTEGNDENLRMKESEDMRLSSHTLPHEGKPTCCFFHGFTYFHIQ